MARRHMDFVIREGSRYASQLVFRFYQNRSRLYGFNEDHPTNIGGVYKVYYSWGILARDVMDNGELEPNARVIFEMRMDEGSALLDLAGSLHEMLNESDCGGTDLYMLSMGQPGSMWEIHDDVIEPMDAPADDAEDQGADEGVTEGSHAYTFTVFDNLSGLGFRFGLNHESATAFANYLDGVNSYMMENSLPM